METVLETRRITILVVCTGNACRSQMLQGFLEREPVLDVYSAGIDPKGLSRRASAVMKEIGVDISGHGSNHVCEYAGIPFDYIVTVCDDAREACPAFPAGGKRIHRSFPDPDRAAGSEEEVLDAFRKTRDMIRDYAAELIALVLSDGWNVREDLQV